MRFRLMPLIVTIAHLYPFSLTAVAQTAEDPYLWLEDVSSPRALAWVQAENSKTVAVLETDPHFPRFYAEALTIAEATDRIPVPRFSGGEIFNFWQDAKHIKGVWRKTTRDDYRKPEPAWQTILDLDVLDTSENANWFWQGATCLRPAQRLCLVSLDDGGEDAVTIREFDTVTAQFVSHGFVLPKSKQSAAWLGADRLMVARDWGKGTMTASGYPYIVKSIGRGEPLSKAREVFRGKPSDVEVEVSTLEDGDGNKAELIVRGVSFFETETYLVTPKGVKKLNLPLKADVTELVAGRLLVTLRQDWSINGANFPQGNLVSIDLRAAETDPINLSPVLVFAPGPRGSLGEVGATRSHLIVTSYDNVKGRAAVFSPTPDGGWSRRQITLPDNVSVSIADTDAYSENAFLYVTGFLTPSTLWLIDAANEGDASVVKSLPAKFDASHDVVEQYEARSKDGTEIPYFVVHGATMRANGENPTIIDAYGGFQVSETPFYAPTIGKLWLEPGNVFVVANIRGGGEFGPAWHEAGLKTHRQLVFDDFAAVAEDLIGRHITSPRRLGIEGGSNGGLLMGVEFTQHPELWEAVDIQVPLLDMLRFEKIAAGSSWVGEYGSVSNPEEKRFLASISPYNNLIAGVRYPQPFIWTTTKDDRVGPQHARKFAAKLAALGIPYLFYEVTEGGHGSGANLKEKAHTTALEMTYFTRKLADDSNISAGPVGHD